MLLILFGLASVGFIDAAYLTAKAFSGLPASCAILEGCEKVLTSNYASFFGVPIALLGAIYYLAILILLLAHSEQKELTQIKLIAALSGLGFLASLWFIYLQVFVIGALCFYCLISAAASTAIFIGSLYILWRAKT